MIVKKGRKWLVVTKGTGRVLGRHTSRRAALKQLAAVEISKARRRPREHERRIKTKRGRIRRIINKGVHYRR